MPIAGRQLLGSLNQLIDEVIAGHHLGNIGLNGVHQILCRQQQVGKITHKSANAAANTAAAKHAVGQRVGSQNRRVRKKSTEDSTSSQVIGLHYREQQSSVSWLGRLACSCCICHSLQQLA